MKGIYAFRNLLPLGVQLRVTTRTAVIAVVVVVVVVLVVESSSTVNYSI
jgi:hypothetical protein